MPHHKITTDHDFGQNFTAVSGLELPSPVSNDFTRHISDAVASLFTCRCHNCNNNKTAEKPTCSFRHLKMAHR